MNSLSAIGNINNPELRYTSGDKPLAILSFSFALNSGYGEKQVTTWLNCSITGKRAEVLSEMVKKGDKVGISGELTNRKYTDKSGNDKYSLECRLNDLTLLGKKDDTNTQPSKNNAPSKQESGNTGGFDDFEDDIPF